jgi:malate synthase
MEYRIRHADGSERWVTDRSSAPKSGPDEPKWVDGVLFDITERKHSEADRQRQAELDAGQMPDFLAETHSIRQGDWQVAPVPRDLQDRRVEITGPVERKMIINALNSGADAYMTDFEDSNAPNWDNQITGQINLIEAVRRTITLQQGEKTYRLNDKIATLLVRRVAGT